MDGAGEDIVARLAEIDLIVGMDRLAADRLAEQAGGAVGDHLVGVHVAAGPGAGLENIDRKMRVKLTLNHFGCGAYDGVSRLGGQ